MTKIKLWAASLVQMRDECPRCFWRRYVINSQRTLGFAGTDVYARPLDPGYAIVGRVFLSCSSAHVA